MTETILVLNAGSSSIKFSLFAEAGIELAIVARGQIEGIDTSPHFIAQDANGQMASEQRWAQGTQLGFTTMKVMGLDIPSWGTKSNQTSKVISEILV